MAAILYQYVHFELNRKNLLITKNKCQEQGQGTQEKGPFGFWALMFSVWNRNQPDVQPGELCVSTMD